MCGPFAGAIVSGLSSVAGFAADQADYQAKAQQWRQNYTNALAAGVDDQKQLFVRETQESEQLVQKEGLQEVERAKAVAEAEVSAASGNITGLSVSNIMTGLNRQALVNTEAMKTNHQNIVLQLQKEKEGTNTEILNRINSVQRPVAPSPLGAIASGIGGVLKAVPEGTFS